MTHIGNPFAMWQDLKTVKEISQMKLSDVLALAKAHPDVVGQVLGAVSAAAQADPALIPDALTAVETKSYAGFAFKHLGVLLNLVGILTAKPDVVAAIGAIGK